MKIRNERMISATAWVASKVIRGWIGSLKVRYETLEPKINPRKPDNQGPCIVAFWHDVMLLPAHVYGRPDIDCHVLISRHADGQLIAETAERLGFKTARGSSSRGGAEAVRDMMRNAHNVAITPDGPRGPRRKVQPGIIYLASRTGLPLISFGVGFDRPWRAKSWDRFALPRPFHRAVMVTSGPLYVPENADREMLEAYRHLFQEQMDKATSIAEEMAGSQVVRAA